MPFKAGESGNKNGRPKLTAQQKNERERFVALLRENTVMALEAVVEIAGDVRSRDRLKACQYLIDKAYGANAVFLTDQGESEPLVVRIVRVGSDEQLEDRDDEWD